MSDAMERAYQAARRALVGIGPLHEAELVVDAFLAELGTCPAKYCNDGWVSEPTKLFPNGKDCSVCNGTGKVPVAVYDGKVFTEHVTTYHTDEFGGTVLLSADSRYVPTDLPTEVIVPCEHGWCAPICRIQKGCPGGRRYRIEEVIHMDFNEPLFRLVEVDDE